MSLLGRGLRSAVFTGWTDVSRSPNNALFGLNYNFGGLSYAGISVTPEVALTFSAVFACIRLISDTISSMPIDLYQKYPGARYERALLPWMQQPNSEMTWQTFVQVLMTSRLTDGNAYFLPIEKGGRIIEVWPLDPGRVDTVRSDGGSLGYLVNKKPISPRNIVHIRGLTLPGYDKGLSPIECARHTVGLALSAEKHGSKLFANGTAFDTVIKAKQRLTPEDAKKLAVGFAAAHKGDSSFHAGDHRPGRRHLAHVHDLGRGAVPRHAHLSDRRDSSLVRGATSPHSPHREDYLVGVRRGGDEPSLLAGRHHPRTREIRDGLQSPGEDGEPGLLHQVQRLVFAAREHGRP